jgi:single-strand DNA-binding protein
MQPQPQEPFIVGNLGGEPELKSIGNNKFVCNFSVATSEEWLDKATKQKKQKVEWHNISVFGKLAEIVSSYCYIAPLHFLKPLPLNKTS